MEGNTNKFCKSKLEKKKHIESYRGSNMKLLSNDVSFIHHSFTFVKNYLLDTT